MESFTPASSPSRTLSSKRRSRSPAFGSRPSDNPMRRPVIRRAVIAAALIFGLAAHLPAALPSAPDGYVTDAAGVLSDRTESALEATLADLDRKTRAQLAVVTVPSLDG